MPYALNHPVISADGEIDDRQLTVTAEDDTHAIEQLHDHYRGSDEYTLSVNTPSTVDETPLLFQQQPNEYVLRPLPQARCWTGVGPLRLTSNRNTTVLTLMFMTPTLTLTHPSVHWPYCTPICYPTLAIRQYDIPSNKLALRLVVMRVL
jgi:hypothetical protein